MKFIKRLKIFTTRLFLGLFFAGYRIDGKVVQIEYNILGLKLSKVRMYGNSKTALTYYCNSVNKLIEDMKRRII